MLRTLLWTGHALALLAALAWAAIVVINPLGRELPTSTLVILGGITAVLTTTLAVGTLALRREAGHPALRGVVVVLELCGVFGTGLTPVVGGPRLLLAAAIAVLLIVTGARPEPA